MQEESTLFSEEEWHALISRHVHLVSSLPFFIELTWAPKPSMKSMLAQLGDRAGSHLKGVVSLLL